MEIAICDKDNGCCSQIEKWLDSYRVVEKVDISTAVYYSAQRFLEELRSGRCFDIIFLDMELPDLSGIKVGHEIRHLLKNDYVNIVFMSEKTTYCLELFELEPLNYHQKPLERERVLADVKKVVGRGDRGQKVLKYADMGIRKGIPLKDIMYASAVEKGVQVREVDGSDVWIRDTIVNMDERYSQYFLCQCHRSFLVNLSYVEKYHNRCFQMRDGTEIPVGKKYAENIKEAWVKYGQEA
jgi:DNA-binding LytR/AlgR family response regulator